jgi:hypothetical protein
MPTAQASVPQVAALTTSQLCDLLNFAAGLPAIDYPAISVFRMALATLRQRREIESWAEARLRNSLNLAIPRSGRVGWPGASFPRELRHLVPTFRTVLTLHCMAFYELLDSVQFAKKLNVPVSWARDHTRSRVPESEQIPHVRLGRYVRFEWGSPALDRWLEEHRKGKK